MEDQASTYSGAMIVFKLFVLALPATVLPYVRPAHSHTPLLFTLVYSFI
jgi:hypothetical protein